MYDVDSVTKRRSKRKPTAKNDDGQNVEIINVEWNITLNGKKRRLGQKVEGKKCRRVQNVDKEKRRLEITSKRKKVDFFPLLAFRCFISVTDI
jgi:hypothetical protein